MKSAHRANLIIALFMLVVIGVSGYAYNAYVTRSVTDAIYNDRQALTDYNTEIIAALTQTESTEEWAAIINQYDEVVIAIKDSANRIILRSDGRSWSALDVKIRTPFEYHNRAYMIITSMYLLRDYTTHNRDLVQFVFIESMIGLSVLCVLVFVVYTLLLRPYHRFYLLMEKYERGEALPQHKFRGNIGKIYARFLEMTRNLEQQQQNQRRIIASISHDIKSPLTSVLGYTERLQKGGLSPERQQQYLSTIYAKSNEMQTLINEFDEYLSYKMETAAHTELLNTETLCGCLRKEFEDELAYSGIQFTLQNAAPNTTLRVDCAKMKRVAGNIISNSAKHVPHPGGKIVCTVDADKQNVFFRFADNGDGVPEDKLRLIFEPLYTSDTSRKVAGLGLSISKEIVEAHGGTIAAAPAALGGLEICITLPRANE